LLRREPGHAAAHARLGELARARGDHPGALRHFLQALRVDERPEIMVAAADAYGRVGRLDDAVALYGDVIARAPGHLTALRALRDLTAAGGRWTDAAAAQERLVGAVDSRARAGEQVELAGLHYERGRACATAGASDDAISAFRDALRVQPDFVPAAVALGDAYLAAGDAAQAVKVWERAAESQPALPLLSRIERQRGAQRGEEIAQRCRQRPPATELERVQRVPGMITVAGGRPRVRERRPLAATGAADAAAARGRVPRARHPGESDEWQPAHGATRP